MKISIIIPVYKPQWWFDECIESISKQTYPTNDFEVILILNGDLSYEKYVRDIISKYSDKLNISLYLSELGSVSNARNIGIDNCTGEYILFVDSDDVVSPFYVQGLIECSNKNQIGVSRTLFFHDSITESYKSSDIITKETNILKYKSLFRNRKILSGICGKCIHRNIVAMEKFNRNFQIGEDNLFWLSISPRIKEFKLSDISCVYYVRESRHDSLSRNRYKFSYLLKTTISRNIEIIKIYCRNPTKNDFWLFLAKLISFTRSLFRMMS